MKYFSSEKHTLKLIINQNIETYVLLFKVNAFCE